MGSSAATERGGSAGDVIRSVIPARIDRLPWAPFHTRMVMALGVAWVLDGLLEGEVRNRITVDPDTAAGARVALERMLELG